MRTRDAAASTVRAPRRQERWRWWLVIVPACIAAIAIEASRSSDLRPVPVAVAIALGAVAGALILVAMHRRSVSAWLEDRRELRLAAARRSGSGVLRPIAQAKEGEARVRGRVRIIRPVAAPEGELVAAFRARRVVTAPDSDEAGPGHETFDVVETAACGRFAVDDGSGVAIVDDDVFAIEPLDVGALPSTGALLLALRDGDLVEVVGPARRAPMPPDLAPVGGEEATALVFDGEPGSPVLLVPLPIGASMAPPRLFAKMTPTPHGLATQDHEALSEVEAGGRAEAERGGRFTGAGE